MVFQRSWKTPCTHRPRASSITISAASGSRCVAPLWVAPLLTGMDLCAMVRLVDMMESRPSRTSGCWNSAGALTRTCRGCPAHRLPAEARYTEGFKLFRFVCAPMDAMEHVGNIPGLGVGSFPGRFAEGGL